MQWLGFHAAAGAGKDTAADYVLRVYGGEKISLADPLKRFCRAVFGFSEAQLWGPSANRNKPDPRYAGPLRTGTLHIARVRFRENNSDWLDEVFPEATIPQRIDATDALQAWLDDVLAQPQVTPRYALQTLGTEWGRQINEDIWLLCAEREAVNRQVDGFVVVADCRFVNEAAFIRSRGGLVVKIVRPGCDGSDALAAGVPTHASEMARVVDAEAFARHVTHTINNDATLDTFYRRVAEALKEGTHEGVQGT